MIIREITSRGLHGRSKTLVQKKKEKALGLGALLDSFGCDLNCIRPISGLSWGGLLFILIFRFMTNHLFLIREE